MANAISGLSSGFDWTSMISQLMEVERAPITLLEKKQTTLSSRITAWSVVNTRLSALNTAVSALSDTDDYDIFTSNASVTGTSKDVDDLLSFAVGTNASQGSYDITIDNLAKAQKLGSRSFDSSSESLNITGDVIINGKVLSIEATDSLSSIRTKINALNSGQNPSGVVASIYTVASGEYRLSLTAQDTGSDGISIANASSENVLSSLGFADNTLVLRNSITGGARSEGFTSSTEALGSLLGLTNASSGLVSIAGESISIDLATDSLETIKAKINANVNLQAAGISASVLSSTTDGKTAYTLQIDGTQTFSDSGNILQTLGILKQGVSDVSGLTGSTVNTTEGRTITSNTLLTEIDGYNTWTLGDSIRITGTNHSGTAITPVDFSITSTSTMSDLMDAIKTAFGSEVSVAVNGNGALVVEDNQAGASSLSMTLSSTIASGNSTLDFGTFASSTVRNREIVAGEDAQITLDDVTITRKSNQITDVISGVTLNLKDEDASAHVTLNIVRDYEDIKDKITSFVENYNDLMTYINTQSTYTETKSSGSDSTTQNTPPLFGDSTLQTIKSTLRGMILSGVSGIDSDLDHLSIIGINMDKEGKLSINSSKLDGYLQTNFEDVMNLFVAQGSSTSSQLSYISSGEKTLEGTYDVDITQAATIASTTGSGFSGSLGTGSTVSITDSNGRTAQVSLSAGWNITSIVNAINSEIAKEYQQVLVGANSLYADSSQSNHITGETTWSSVYDGSGSSANLADADVISFTGTNRSGSAVAGTYTISSAATDTVNGLLSAIEAEFGSGYDAYIDTEGRIAIKDTTSGNSSLSLTVATVKNLDFGSIDVDPAGTDGSQSGRYALDITAANDGGQLKISNNAYGSSSFTLAVTGGNLGMTDGTYTGLDVAGRIRKTGSSTWLTMTGSGQTLTGNDDQDVEDLVVKYTGTGTGTFDFSFITGVAEKFDRALYYMTNSIDGYVSNKEDLLNDQISTIDDKISDLEARIAKKQQDLINKYVAMETMLSKLQSQQSWLTGVLNSLSTST